MTGVQTCALPISSLPPVTKGTIEAPLSTAPLPAKLKISMITVTAFPRSARQGTAFISTYRDITKDIKERKDQAEPTVTSLPEEI